MPAKSKALKEPIVSQCLLFQAACELAGKVTATGTLQLMDEDVELAPKLKRKKEMSGTKDITILNNTDFNIQNLSMSEQCIGTYKITH